MVGIPGRLQLRGAVLERRALCVELRLAVGDLLLGVGHLLLGARLLLREFRHAAVVGGLAVGELLLARGDGDGRIVELALRVVKLRKSVGLLALVVGALLVELLLGVGLQRVDACLLALGSERFDAIHDLGHAPVVRIARRGFGRGAAHGQERLGVRQVGREVACGHVHVLLDGARSERGVPHAGRGGVIRGVHEADDGVRAGCERVVHVLRALGDGHRVADAHGVVHHEVGGQHAFALGLRPRALGEDGAVQVVGVVGVRMHAVGGVARARGIGQRVHARGVLLTSDGGHDVGLARRHDRLDAFHAAQGRDVGVGEAERRDDADVHERRAVVEFVGRQLHVGSRHAQARVEARAERDDGRDGQETPERMGDGADGFGVERVLHSCAVYHSMDSAEAGASFTSTLATRPSRIWMTRSAMSVNAELCVMSTTVLPVLKNVSCNSLRIALPVW